MPVAKRRDLLRDIAVELRMCSTMMSGDVESYRADLVACRQQGGRPLTSPFEGCEPSLECAWVGFLVAACEAVIVLAGCVPGT